MLISKPKQIGRPPCPHHYIHLPARRHNDVVQALSLTILTGRELGLHVRARVPVVVAAQDPFYVRKINKSMLARVEMKLSERERKTVHPIVPPTSSDDDSDDPFYVRKINKSM